MKKQYTLKLFVFAMLFCLPWMGYAQKKSTVFAPVGSKWLYENVGPDTSIKTIKIERDGIGTVSGIWCSFNDKPILKMTLLDKDSNVMKVTQDDFPYSGAFVKGDTAEYAPITMGCMGYLYLFSPKPEYSYEFFINNYYDNNSYNWTFSTMDSIKINGRYLRMYDISSKQKPDKCIRFCGPIIERIGSLGYLFPMSTCRFFRYFGRLISYYDPEFGYWKVPDSMRKLACVDHFHGAATDPFNTDAGVKIYPNPTTNSITIEWPVKEHAAEYELYNYAGQKNLSGKFAENSGSQNISLKGQYPLGLYFLRIRDGNDWHVARVELVE